MDTASSLSTAFWLPVPSPVYSVTQIRQEYEEHVKSLQQETEQVAQQLEELQLNHNLHQVTPHQLLGS